jgi:hypothetical protein
MTPQDRHEAIQLINAQRQAVLAVIENDEPFTAMVSYATEDVVMAHGKQLSLLIHLSNLSAHKRQLLSHPRCSLLICKPDTGAGEVLALPRVSLQCRAERIDKNEPEYEAAKQTYLAKLSTSALMFSLPDFDLIRLIPTSGRYVAGFGRAFTLSQANF